MKNKFYLAIVALAAIALVSGCAKDGAVGPQGPPGVDGNANVIGTNSVQVAWLYNNVSNTYTDTLTANGITQDILDKGIVQVYALYNNTEWWVLPDVNGSTVTTYGYGLGYISLESFTLDNSLPSPPATVRVVIVSASNRMAHPNVNWKNYPEVKSALHLQD